MNKVKMRLFEILFPEEFNELETKRRNVKTLSEKISELKIKLRVAESKFSRVSGELTRLKMASGMKII